MLDFSLKQHKRSEIDFNTKKNFCRSLKPCTFLNESFLKPELGKTRPVTVTMIFVFQ